MLCAQQKIAGQFSTNDDYKWVLLYRVTPQNSEYVDRATVSEEGDFEFTLEEEHQPGMYKLVYDVPQDQYNFDIIYNAKEDVVFTFSSEKGLEYSSSTENKLMSSYTKSIGMVSQSIGNFYNQQSTDSTALLAIFNTLKDTQQEYEKLAENTIVSNFIKANRPYIPQKFENVSEYITNIRSHYFDHVDFNNSILQSSSFLVERVLNFVFGMSTDGQTDATIYQNNIVDVVKAMQKATPETQKIILNILWQQLAESNYEDLANFITDNYLLKLATELKQDDLVNELVQFKNLSFGMPAPDFDVTFIENNKDVTKKLSQLEISQYYVLVFWSSGCSHCLEELPQLQSFMKKFKPEEVKVVAFGLEEEDYRWKSQIINFPDFIHVIGLGKWDNEIGKAYNISATPTYFVLDKDKKILAKPLDLEELKTVLQ
jgi:thiol-disulfide isomerase/thioredoxin